MFEVQPVTLRADWSFGFSTRGRLPSSAKQYKTGMMIMSYKKGELNLIETGRVALEGVANQPEVKTAMAAFGHDDAKMTEMQTAWQNARDSYDANKVEDSEADEAYDLFEDKYDKLVSTFRKNRRKAKVCFMNDAIKAAKLGVLKPVPSAYQSRMETIKVFYKAALDDADAQAALTNFQLPVEELNAGVTMVSEVESLRASYLLEKGQSQSATKKKDKALAILDDYLREFYAVAGLALEDDPQLLESLGKFVRS